MKKKIYTVGGVKTDKPKTLPTNFAIKVHSQEHYQAVVDKLYDMGFSWQDDTSEEFCQEDTFEGSKVEYVVGGDDTVQIISSDTTDDTRLSWLSLPVITLDDLYTLKSYMKKVVLNDDYAAVVWKDRVQVGCQQIPFDKVEELYHAVQEIKH